MSRPDAHSTPGRRSPRRIAAGAIALSLLVASPALPQAHSPTESERTVRALERAWLDAYEQLDSTAMKRIVADDFLITFPDGSTQTKARILADLEASRARPSGTRFRTERVSSRAYGNDVVVLTGVVVTISTRGGRTVEERSRYTDTYVRRAGRWQVVASHLSNVPEEPDAASARADSVRSVRHNVLVSRALPPMRMEVDPRLPYVGALSFPMGTAVQVQRHVFASRDDRGRPRRMLIVQFESLGPESKGYTFRIENPTRLGAHDYRTDLGLFNFDSAAAARPGAEAEHTQRYLAGQGIGVAGEDFLVARYARTVDAERRSEIIVFYYENLREHGATRAELQAGGRRESERQGLLRDVAARSRITFAIRDATD